jgi:thiol-disulfide isomerase/thioredoxin
MKKILILLILFPFMANGHAGSCILRGQVIDRDSKILRLSRETDEIRYQYTEIHIDENGRFMHKLDYPALEAYRLIFEDELEKGEWFPITFFPDNDTVDFVLYPLEIYEQSLVINSSLTSGLDKVYAEVQQEFSQIYLNLKNELDSVTMIGQADSEYGRKISERLNSLNEESYFFGLRKAKKELNPLGYHLFLTIAATGPNIPVDTLIWYQKFFEAALPQHPYNEISRLMINSLKEIKPGGRFIDFNASDRNGVDYNFQNLISESKFTLLDMWAPWCSPCIGKSRSILQNYDQLKASGLKVVAVVGGVRNESEFTRAIERHNYPWLTLSEINNSNQLWRKYNIEGSGGSQFLINNQGTILGINLSAEEIKEIIKK